MSDSTEFINAINESPTDLHLVSLLMQIFDQSDMVLIIAALTRAEELAIKQQEKKNEHILRN